MTTPNDGAPPMGRDPMGRESERAAANDLSDDEKYGLVWLSRAAIARNDDAKRASAVLSLLARYEAKAKAVSSAPAPAEDAAAEADRRLLDDVRELVRVVEDADMDDTLGSLKFWPGTSRSDWAVVAATALLPRFDALLRRLTPVSGRPPQQEPTDA